MRLIPITMCRPGMKLAQRIFAEDGQILLTEQKELTDRLIRRLGQCGISYVYIQDGATDDIEVPQLITDETRIRALGELRSAFRTMANTPGRKGVTYPYVAKQFKGIMTSILDEIADREDAMIMLHNMGTVDHYLYQHSLNVCIYTTLLGISAGYTKDELMVLGLGALLHDVGKIYIPQPLLAKPGSLTKQEYAAIQRHTEQGFQLLKDEPNLPLLVAHCALQHHERLDGSGYPRGIRGDEIHDYAKWIGVVDSYDAMTSSRVYRSAMLPHQAIESLFAGTGTLYEQHMIQVFRDKVAIYPIGLTVKLSTGEEGVVVDINAAYAHRPVIRVLFNEAGDLLREPYEIDLSKHLSIMITAIPGEDIGPDSAAG
ncbi:hypothetical protein DNH61_17775 [Paenibacillus sambharensis]|uniref:HD-GYP domain-containing protein n=1 Tax=Paenibacillus sambharensis TaxID=1803190 RepID=A0A2W1LGW4_9BACL|nr:HD-GYP domain-containing protein [Paenibacillus sambharensis]PZD94265.1 hypothetical protein DNH61_17775 [Paenibacillus sambharensis]